VANIGIVYWTKTGHTRRAADDLGAQLVARGHQVTLIRLPEDRAHLEDLDVVLVGSPCHAGSIPAQGVGMALPVEQWLRKLPPQSLAGKAAGAFSVHAKLGGQRTVATMERILIAAGAYVVSPGPVVKAGVPLSLWEGKSASEADRKGLRAYADRLADTLSP
jgi:flavodoxin